METIVNLDYIVVIRLNNGKLEISRENIENRHMELTKSLKDMVENKNKTILDLQAHFTRVFDPEKSLKSYNYCYPHKYHSSYIDRARYPQIWTFKEYQDEMKSIQKNFRETNSEELKYKNNPQLLEEAISIELENHAKLLKKNFADDAERYLNAFNYTKVLGILKADKSNKMFSSETIGWTDYDYTINDEISYHLKSNFGYGSSSYFFVNLKYKDIDILPYSDAIKYYYANMKDYIRYTRLYRVDRDSWNTALNFVTETSNFATENPEQFIEQWIFNEVREMMAGLRRIAEKPRESHKEAIENKFKDEDIITVRNITEYQTKLYKAYPEELMMAFQAEKITGSLYFLEKLRAVSEIFPQVQNSIGEIIDINRKLAPLFKEYLGKITQEVEVRNKKLDKLNEKEKELEELCAPHLKEIEKIIDDAHKENKIVFRASLFKYYCSEHNDFAEIWNQLSALRKSIGESEADIQKRQHFADIISECIDHANEVLSAA